MTRFTLFDPTYRRGLIAAILYAALSVGANPARAEPDWTGIEAMKSGQMKGLAIHGGAEATSDTMFLDPQGFETTLERFEGKVTVLNFWATWCGPCRKEMPTLDALQEALGGEEFAVELIATGPRNEPEKIDRFFADQNIANLKSHRDPNGALARDLGVLGLPITLILDPQGNEIARLRGDADWNSADAIAILSAIIKGYSGTQT